MGIGNIHCHHYQYGQWPGMVAHQAVEGHGGRGVPTDRNNHSKHSIHITELHSRPMSNSSKMSSTFSRELILSGAIHPLCK